ncbi:MAG: hypothetical protein MJZ64_08305 [Paludibacteraceae bacterium]|nr:hypothetical protein [Paludibacteraceae bacterium]
MARRQTSNRTGIDRLPSIDTNAVWVSFTCVNCGKQNVVPVGKKRLELQQVYDTAEWECEHCGYVHAKDSDLPAKWKDTWKEDFLIADSEQAQAFWKGFFRMSTLSPDVYWKQCNVCGRVLPATSFDRHIGWGALEKQLECKSCKGAINAALNPKRTSEQLRESSLRRRIGDLFSPNDTQIDVKQLFDRFGSKCFMTGKSLDIANTSSWHIDHILPSKYFYALTPENACLLSAEANSKKRDRWPSLVYTDKQLVELAKITGANLELLLSKEPIMNTDIDVNKAFERWTDVRDTSDLHKRIAEFRKVIIDNKLEDKLTEKNKKILGFT